MAVTAGVLQVPECPGPCCRRTLPCSISIECLSELNHLLEAERVGAPVLVRSSSPSCVESKEGDSSAGQRVAGGSSRPVAEHDCELCDMSCYSTSCYSTSCYSTSCYSNSGYEGRGRLCSHTRLSSVDSNRLSGSTVFSSQEEDEDENSIFESVPDVSPEVQEGGGGGDRRTARWKDAHQGEPRETAVPGPSNRSGIGELDRFTTFTKSWKHPINSFNNNQSKLMNPKKPQQHKNMLP